MQYVVNSGDTLEAIAKKYNVSLEDIISSNPQIANPHQIQVGDKINIPGNSLGADPPPLWCALVLNTVDNGLPDPGVALVQTPGRNNVFVAIKNTPTPGSFGRQYNIYTAWIASSLSPLTVKDFIDLLPSSDAKIWFNQKDIPTLTSSDYILVTPEKLGHTLQPTNPLVLLRGNLADCPKGI